MSVNKDKNEYMNAVSSIAEGWRSRSFEACLNGFMKSMISQCSSVDVPKNIELGDKTKIIESVKSTIDNSTKEFVKSALDPENESGKLYDVDLAHEITSPANLNDSVMKLLANHIYDESKDRAEVLAAEFDAGSINNLSEDQAVEHIRDMYTNTGFDVRFNNGSSFKKGMHELLSVEGEMVVDEIKDEVANLVNETEAKNSIIREAVSDINAKKAEIETKINGDDEEPTDDPAKEGDANDADSENNSNPNDEASTGTDNSNDESQNNDTSTQDDQGDTATSTEGWHQIAVKNIKTGKKIYSKESFYSIIDTTPTAHHLAAQSNESLNADKNTFSREAAEQILDKFRELEDGIDTETGEVSENTLSVSNNTQKEPTTNDPDAESAENTYVDDDNNEIKVNEDAFNYQEISPTILETENELKKANDELSEESIAKQFFPLNLLKAANTKVRASKRLPVFLALQKDRGQEFFDQTYNRFMLLNEMMSKEDIQKLEPTLTTDETADKLKKTLDLCTNVKEDTKTILEDLGILGILDNKYQRVDSHVDNAVLSLFNANILPTSSMGKDAAGKDISVSTEELYENDLAEIFKLAVKKADITMDITAGNGLNVVEDKDQLGYIDELLNEKMFSVVKPEDKDQVEEKVKTLYSLECICPIQEVANIQAFVSKDNAGNEQSKVVLDSLKDIDGYGYSYTDEIEKIKKDVKAKFDQVKDDKTNFNFNTDNLVEMVAEQQDTTKLEANLFEQTLSKLCENKTIENSTEGLIIRNKAKTILTSYIVAEKLGYLRDSDIQQFRNFVY